MNDHILPQKPERLIVQPLSDGCLVFDPMLQQAHHLDPLSERVLEACDGTKTRQEMASQLDGHEIPPGALLDYTLELLRTRGLLHDRQHGQGPTRREFLRRFGQAAALPVIASMALPTPAQAASCVAPSGACGAAADCCLNAMSGQHLCVGSRCCSTPGGPCVTNGSRTECCSGSTMPNVCSAADGFTCCNDGAVANSCASSASCCAGLTCQGGIPGTCM
ncbi:MAG: hypothetical protein KC910_20380 [Candidatus Eremiobacteraeota bacterium]|nr:hypothetical protein [Candidatus Eremiobacteraeota bacterium]